MKVDSSNSRVFLVHKPEGILSSTVDSRLSQTESDCDKESQARRVARKTVYDVVAEAGFPVDCGLVGRLDYDTSGIMVFTDDSALATAIRDPISTENYALGSEYISAKTKEYLLCLLQGKKQERFFFPDGNFNSAALVEELSSPLTFRRFGQDHCVNSANISFLRRYQDPKFSHGRPSLGWCIEVVVRIAEGKHRQIRRIANRSGFHVVSLTRTKIGKLLVLSSVPNPGDCRWLSTEEKRSLYQSYGLT